MLHFSTENREKYQGVRKELIKKVRNAKRSQEKKLANSKENYIKSKTKTITTIGPLKGENSRLITEDKEMAEELYKFFSTVFTKEDISTVPMLPAETEKRFLLTLPTLILRGPFGPQEGYQSFS